MPTKSRLLSALRNCLASAALSALLTLPVLLPQTARAQQVYVGAADQWDDLLAHPDQWKFVRENADGFYVNFIEMDWMKKNGEKLGRTAALFTQKNALMESDMHAGLEGDQRYIRQLQEAGFTVPYTSLNYGWSAERAANLKTFLLPPKQTPRLNLVQLGPWAIGGDIKSDKGDTSVATNAQYRAWITQSDGVSTDGPMGFWLSDQGGMHAGSFSVVRYAQARKKKSMVMLCPYGAGVNLYNPAQALSMAQQCVREHEDNGTIPTIWGVFEYATDIAAVPEEVSGKPISTTSGIAYWLIHHIKDPQRAATLTVLPQPGVKTTTAGADVTFSATSPQTITCQLANSSSWLDLCPVIHARIDEAGRDWDIRFMLNKTEVTDAMRDDGGLVCVGGLRLWHEAKYPLSITLTPKAPKNGAGASPKKPITITLTLTPHPSQPSRIQQEVVFHVTPQ